MIFYYSLFLMNHGMIGSISKQLPPNLARVCSAKARGLSTRAPLTSNHYASGC